MKDCDCPLSEAVIWAEPLLVNARAVAVKLAVVAPAVAVTDAGTETLVLLELSATAAPDPEAGWLSVTIQADVPLGLTEAGLQLSAETWARIAKVSEAEAVLPLSEAVI